MLPSLDVFSLAGSFTCLFLLFGLSARYMLLGLFYVGLFSVRTFFFAGSSGRYIKYLRPKVLTTEIADTNGRIDQPAGGMRPGCPSAPQCLGK
jgi:hypothetical protein